MFCFQVLCALLGLIAILLSVKIVLLKKAAREIGAGVSEWLKNDTNTLLTVSVSDKQIRGLADELNKELFMIRKERIRYENGTKELKDAITNISHDLRTPLTAVYGYLELLEKEEHSERAAGYLKIIENRMDAMKLLTEELFRYTTVSSREKKYETVVLNRALEESISAYYGALKSGGISPCIEIPETKIKRCLDRAALARIFANIISNAVRYSDGDLRIRLYVTGEIVFSNTASRLNEIETGKLFQRYYTVEDANRSTGLGLSIAKELTEQMGGMAKAIYQNGELEIRLLFPEYIESNHRRREN